MRILFMGTPDIAAECLKALYAAGHEICAVYTRRDKPVGRKQVLTAPPVKEVALAHGTPVFQPRTLRDGSEDENIRALAPELIVVVAYGCILPKSVLETPKYGCINLHVSLLPKYRGSAPVQWAVLNGDAETGVSIMYMAEELDAGDVILTAKTPIDLEEDLPSLWDRLAKVGAEALAEALPLLAAGTAPRTPQDSTPATFAPMLSRELSPIDWTKPVAAIRNQVRGLIPWPCATAELAGQRFKIYKTAVGTATDKTPGTLLSTGKKGIEVACGDRQSLWITELQAEGGKRMSAAAYLLGHPMNI